MGKKNKNQKVQEKSKIVIKLQKNKRQKRIKKTSNFLQYINSSNLNRNQEIKLSSNLSTLDKLKNLFEILTDFFDLDDNLFSQAQKKISDLLLNIQYQQNLYLDFDYLLNEEKFYETVLIYIKKIYSEKKELDIILASDKLKFDYYSFFNFFKTNDLKETLFLDKITSFIRQDLILNCFSSYYFIADYFNIIRMKDKLFRKIDKNKLIRDEGIEEFKNNYLYSSVIMESIILTLKNFVPEIEESDLKSKIELILSKTNFYISYIPQNFSAITFLGNNIVIREYFYKFRNNDIKVCLRNVISNEIIHELIIKYSNNNYFNTSLLSSNGKVEESGEYFENILLGGMIYYYSPDDINYLSELNNFSKNLSNFSTEIRHIHSKYKSIEKLIIEKSDNECISKNIVRGKKTFFNINGFIYVGRCSRSYRNYIVDKLIKYC